MPSKTLLSVARSIWRFRRTRLHYIPNGIDCTRFAEASGDAKAPLRNDADEVLIGAIGALRAEKNLGRLLHLFARLKTDRPRRLIIVGDGPERAALQSLAESLGIAEATRFTGEVANPESILAELDIFALTSDTEQMPYCLIEAMAAGLPIVATDVGDISSMLSPANQPFIAPPEARTLLTAQLQRLIERPNLRQTIGELNRRHAEKSFDRQAMLKRYRDLFSSLIPG